MRYLLVLDVPSIKEYVLNSERLVEVRGASALLDQLNRELTPNFLKEQLGNDNVTCIFVGGGGGQFIIRSDEAAINKAVAALKGEFYRRSSGGLRLISGVADYTKSSYQDSLQCAFSRLNCEKDEFPFTVQSSIHTGLMRECESCSKPASVIDNYADSEWILCETCHGKVEFASHNRSLWNSFADFLESTKLIKAKRPKDFEDIATSSLKKGYLALVYADGNSMGKLIKTIDTPESFAFFSKVVDTAVRQSCHEALFEAGVGCDGLADILLLGGDDLLVCMNSDAAIRFTILAAKKFEQKTHSMFASDPVNAPKMLKGKGMTISFGIVFAKSHTPFSLLLNQAEQLLKSAKKAGSEDKRAHDYYAPTYLDFHFFSRYNQIDVSVSRKKYLQIYNAENELKAVLHQRPYALEGVEVLNEHAQNILNTKMPRSRMKRLGRAPFLGVMNGSMECLQLIGRTKNDQQKKAIWDALDAFECGTQAPWKGIKNEIKSTMLVDLLEIADFFGPGVKGDNDALY